MLALALEWSRCPDGVEIYEITPDEGNSLLTRLASQAIKGPRYRYRSDRRVPAVYDAVNLENPIVLHFINTQTDDERRAFFDRFGMGTREGEQSVDDVGTWHGYLAASATLALGGVADVRASTVNNLVGRVSLTPSFDYSGEGGQSRMVMHPKSLNQFMCMEIAVAATNGVSMRMCDHCGKLFFTGPLTGRRSTAKFCSDRCRVAAMRKRNAEAGQ